MDERRNNPRFEPEFLDAKVEFGNNQRTQGRVLDSSKGGLAITFSKLDDIPASEQIVDVKIKKFQNIIGAGNATVKRTWQGNENGIICNGKGVSLEFDTYVEDNSELSKILISGVQQNDRISAQKKLITQDLEHLSEYRRDLINCQLKLYSLMITVGVVLAGSYFALTYHSTMINSLDNQTLSFWRTMVAALPGILAIGCALMVVHKSESIQRIDSLLMLLKQYCLINKYPREYKGWESEYRKFRHVLNSKNCQDCKDCGENRCGILNADEQKELDKRGLFTGPTINLYHVILNSSFFFAFFLSIVAVGTELYKFQKGKPLYMFISSGITLLIGFTMLFLFFKFRELRSGKNSIEINKRSWIDLLNKCRWQV